MIENSFDRTQYEHEAKELAEHYAQVKRHTLSAIGAVAFAGVTVALKLWGVL